MSDDDIKSALKKAIVLTAVIEKALKLSQFFDEMSEGIEEIEKSIRISKQNSFINEYFYRNRDNKDKHSKSS